MSVCLTFIFHCFPSCIGSIHSDPIASRARLLGSRPAQWPNPILALSAVASCECDVERKRDMATHIKKPIKLFWIMAR